MSREFQGLKTAFENYAAQVARVMEAHKADVSAAVQRAIDEHDANCSAEMDALQEEIKAAQENLVPPPFEPSNQ